MLCQESFTLKFSWLSDFKGQFPTGALCVDFPGAFFVCDWRLSEICHAPILFFSERKRFVNQVNNFSFNKQGTHVSVDQIVWNPSSSPPLSLFLADAHAHCATTYLSSEPTTKHKNYAWNYHLLLCSMLHSLLMLQDAFSTS